MEVHESTDLTSFYVFLRIYFLPEVKSAPAAGAGLAGRLAVEGILKRLFSCGQRRSKGGVTGAFHLLPYLVEGGCMESSLVGSYLSPSIQLSLLGLYN